MKWYTCEACGKKHHRDDGSDCCRSTQTVRAVHDALPGIGEGLAIHIAFAALHGLPTDAVIGAGRAYNATGQPMIQAGGLWRRATEPELTMMAAAAIVAAV